MADEVITTTTPPAQETAEMTGADYLAALETMRRDMVPREKYETLAREHRQVINAYASGQYLPANEQTKEKSIEELCEALYSPSAMMKSGACENAENILALRNSLIEAGAKDPFLDPQLGDLMEHCLEVAHGNDAVFAAEFESHLVDDVLPTSQKKASTRKW